MMGQDLTGSVESVTENRSAKSGIASMHNQGKKDAEGDIAETSTALAGDTTSFADFTAKCERKSIDGGCGRNYARRDRGQR